MRKHGSPKIITTDKLPSYRAAFCEIGVADKQLCGGRSNNRCENSQLTVSTARASNAVI